MAKRRHGRHSTVGLSRAAALGLAGVFGVLAGGPASASQFEWTEDPARSVLIESGSPIDDSALPARSEASSIYGETVAEPTAMPVDADTSVAFAGDGFCPECNGAGCRRCGAHAWATTLGLGHLNDACWIGRVDALILWRDAPPDRPLIDSAAGTGTLLDANALQSTLAAGPRVSVLRMNNCTGHGIEATYLWVGNFQSTRELPQVADQYILAPPGIYGNDGAAFDAGTASLTSRLQGFELNRHLAIGRSVRFLSGFRWLQWQERFRLQDQAIGGVTDVFETNCINDLYGGQIGLDAALSTSPWFRVESVVKAGAYYNNAVQSSLYTTNDPANPGTAAISVGQSPLNCTFVGEVGLTGVVPITHCLDIRFGYFGLWLSGLAQPTQQLSDQQVTPGQLTDGSINANGGVLLQGATLGLEGRW